MKEIDCRGLEYLKEIKMVKKYFNSIDYTDKNGNFINYYNFINDLDSFNDSFMKDVIKCYFEYIDECF